MKQLLLSALLTLGLAFGASAADKHDHDHDHGKVKAGPNGGRLLTEVEPHAEFLVTKDKKVEIRFIDDDNKTVDPGTREVTVTLGQRTRPTKLTFKKDGDKLVSDKTVPEGNDYPTVVQIREKAGAKAVNAKFNLNMKDCPTCDHAEYACVCDHGDDHDKKDAKDAKKKK